MPSRAPPSGGAGHASYDALGAVAQRDEALSGEIVTTTRGDAKIAIGMNCSRGEMDTVRFILVLVLARRQRRIGQTPATARVMQESSTFPKILEAILASNFALLERESAALAKATEAPAWTVLKGPEYMKQSEAFLKALRELTAAAKEHDLDTAAQRYNALTTSCFGCHKAMKDRRLAGQ